MMRIRTKSRLGIEPVILHSLDGIVADDVAQARADELGVTVVLEHETVLMVHRGHRESITRSGWRKLKEFHPAT